MARGPEQRVFPDSAGLARSLAEAIQAFSLEKRDRSFTIALSGGSTPKLLYELLAQDPFREAVCWEAVKEQCRADLEQRRASEAERRAQEATLRAKQTERLNKTLLTMPDVNPHVRHRIRERCPALRRVPNSKINEAIANAWPSAVTVGGQRHDEEIKIMEICGQKLGFPVTRDKVFKTALTPEQLRANGGGYAYERKREFQGGRARRRRGG